MSNLSTTEVHRLESLERVIDKGMRSFLDVGSALAEIRNDRLYRAQHDSFEDYCKERWGFTGSRGRQLIGAFEGIAGLPEDLPKPVNSAQAAALASVDEESRGEVWADALEDAEERGAEQPTAQEIREAAARRAHDNWATESAGDANIAEVKPMMQQLLKTLSEAADQAERLAKTSAGAWLLTSGSALLKHIRDARDHVSSAKPAGACPICNGDGCARCFETGWVNSTRLRMLKK